MDALRLARRGVTAGLRLGRGTADRVVRLAGPGIARAAAPVVDRLRGTQPSARMPSAPVSTPPAASAASSSPPTTARAAGPAAGREADPPPVDGTAPSGPAGTTPTPATVARNIGAPRPKAAAPKKRKAPSSVPGAKLPPRRPNDS